MGADVSVVWLTPQRQSNRCGCCSGPELGRGNRSGDCRKKGVAASSPRRRGMSRSGADDAVCKHNVCGSMRAELEGDTQAISATHHRPHVNNEENSAMASQYACCALGRAEAIFTASTIRDFPRQAPSQFEERRASSFTIKQHTSNVTNLGL